MSIKKKNKIVASPTKRSSGKLWYKIIYFCFYFCFLTSKRRSSVSPRPSLAILHAKQEMMAKQQQQPDGDSGRSLLIHAERQIHGSTMAQSYAKGRGHQSVVDMDLLYARPHKKDKMVQADIPGYDVGFGYEEVVLNSKGKRPGVFNIELPPSDSDGGSNCSTSSFNNFPVPPLPPCNSSSSYKISDGKPKTAENTKKFKFFSTAAAATMETFKGSPVMKTTGAKKMKNKPQKQGIGSSGQNNSGVQSKYKSPMNQNIHTNNQFILKKKVTDENLHLSRNIQALRPAIPPKPTHLKQSSNKHSTTGNSSDRVVTLESNEQEQQHRLKTKTIASMPGLAEMTFMPENSPVYYEISGETFSDNDDDSDWETKSAISL